MSIWTSKFTLNDDNPLGMPYAVDYPPDVSQAPEAWIDVAATSFADGWVRVGIVEEDGQTEAAVMLNPSQAKALGEALIAVVRNDGYDSDRPSAFAGDDVTKAAEHSDGEECARLRKVAAALAEALREWVEYGGDETKSRDALRQFDRSSDAAT